MTIITDPQIAFGEPTIRGIRTRVIADRFAAGESLLCLSDDYGLSHEELLEALRYEIALPSRRVSKVSNAVGERDEYGLVGSSSWHACVEARKRTPKC